MKVRERSFAWDARCAAGHFDRLYLRASDGDPNQNRVKCDYLMRNPPVVGRAVGECGMPQKWTRR